MNLPALPWFLAGPIATLWAQVGKALWDGFEAAAYKVAQSASVEHSTATGLAILEADLPVQAPNSLSEAARRAYLQFYQDVLAQNAKPSGLDLIQTITGASIWYRDPASGTPFFYLRYWVDLDKLELARELVGILAPARTVKHFQLVAYPGAPGGYGARYGERYGDGFLAFETPAVEVTVGYGTTPYGQAYGD
ncbi:MAG: hypothetical protein A2527_14090 [Candidatus Lambdaproteobacteria bacterium RIFOXYD2_FULL_50_16]|uniref:Uncharacterized protein n=1 Tax=Candidatus Lambdaproteobacteria bacterium RIFOXYD2_FULL_50_16 TaxID=1817772 RepID=A0A1F6G4L1_9PROT|nr:MAG: hypothetical protein A2527_14090 [Candidatus Lambdaproteobacteria bacterium RIFOXYD2_FULL_50_16]